MEDLAVATRSSWIVAFDNMSFLSGELSDAMCRISTGATLSKRAFYTNADEFNIKACRPQILNGIPDRLAYRSDLLDRSIVLHLPTIPPSQRMSEPDFWDDFTRSRPYILSTLLNAITAALRDARRISIENPPRLIGFVQWAEAGCRALGFKEGAFLTAYRSNREAAGSVAIEDNPIAKAVIAMLDDKNREQPGVFSGIASKLLPTLASYAELKDTEGRKWPANPASLSTKLRLAARLLRDAGIDIQFNQVIDRDNKRGIKIRKTS
jgi:hypothetical protein